MRCVSVAVRSVVVAVTLAGLGAAGAGFKNEGGATPAPAPTAPAAGLPTLGMPPAGAGKAAASVDPAGKWKLNKTVTVTLAPNGAVKTQFKSMRDATWSLDGGDTVVIKAADGEVLHSFKVDRTGKAGAGKWRDGSSSSPEKLGD